MGFHKSKRCFARLGIPETVHSDNGPQFSARDFAIFSNEWDIQHTTRSPYHTQSNGKAESSVKLAKKLLTRAADPQLALLENRNTITAGMTTRPYRDCCINPRGLSYRSWTVVEPMRNQTVLRKRGNSEGYSTPTTSI